jgi:hypothetical protein
MPNPAAGVFKQLAYKAESAFGTAAGQASGQSLRRVTSSLDLSKETYQSNEIRTDLQMLDFRHGVRRVQGSIAGELSPGTYKDFFAATLKRDFAAVTASTSVGLTIATSGSYYTVTRSAGSFLSDGYKVGMVIRLSVGALNANNINKNLLILAIGSATVMTVTPLNGSAMTAEGPVTGCTVTATGKVTYIPSSGHTDKSFSIEHWYSDLVQSELFLGCKVAKLGLQLPPTGIATINMDVMGQDYADTTAKRTAVALTSQYFTTPTAATTSGVLAAVNGKIASAGALLANVTGLSIDIMANFTGDPVVGAQTVPFLFAGRVLVSGQMTAYFDSVTQRDAFVAETLTDVILALSVDNTATSEFLTLALPAIKFGGAAKDDGEKGLVATLPFQALLDATGNPTTADTHLTTIQMQDSLA